MLACRERLNAFAARFLGERKWLVAPFSLTSQNLFGVFVTQGLATPGEVVPYILQGGLGLPEREYYLPSDPHMAQIRIAYRAYIDQLFTLAVYDDAAPRRNASTTRSAASSGSRAHLVRLGDQEWSFFFVQLTGDREMDFAMANKGAE